MINYFRTTARDTPVNLAVARILVSGLLVWKLLHYDWGVLTEWPVPLVDTLSFYRHPALFAHVELIALLGVASLLCVLVGYRIRFTAWASAVLVTYLGAVRYAYQISHTSEILFTGALILVLFGVFAEEDKLSVDQLRRTRTMSLDSLTNHLEDDLGRFPNRALRWALIIVGMFYFQSGVSKLALGDPVAWVQPSNLGRYILFRMGEGPSWFVGELLLQYPLLLSVGALATIVLEFGFLPYILTGRRLWPFLLGLIGMHAAIALSVGPVFTDQVVFLAIFLPWDTALGKTQRADDLRVVYDRHCFFCARSLHLFPYLDVAGSVTYYNQYTVPDELDADGVEFEDAMYVFRGTRPFRGYRAFVELFKQLGFLYPVALAMSLPGVRNVGYRTYQHIADNRSRYFVCSLEE